MQCQDLLTWNDLFLYSISYLDMGSTTQPVESNRSVLIFHDEFKSGPLNTNHWIPYYLPQWSSRLQSAPVYSFENECLCLHISKDLQPWCPEFNGEVKCSSLQTGVFSGEKGSVFGQHHFTSNLRVREYQPAEKKFVPLYGYFEIRAKALITTSNVVSLWMIGFEEIPEQSAEICVVEIKGENVQTGTATIGYGVRQFQDPDLKDCFFEDEFKIDVSEFHVYAAEWRPGYVDFFIDHQHIRRIEQSPNYPMQLMLGIYEVPVEVKDEKDKAYPKTFVVDYVKAWR